MDLSEKDLRFLNLIQKTPLPELLSKHLREAREGFPSVNEDEVGSRFQKSRRLYDSILVQCFSYDETRCDLLKKVIQETGNGLAAELLFSLPDPQKSFIYSRLLKDAEDGNTQESTLEKESDKSSTKNGTPDFKNIPLMAYARNGKFEKLENSMINLASQIFDKDINKYKGKLRSIILKMRGWNGKSLLHAAVDGNSVECVEQVLSFAEEADIKFELLDSQNIWGETPLHIAIKKGFNKIVTKLIIEGANIYIKNRIDEYPLQLIYQKRPNLIPFLLDRSVALTGDVGTTALCLNIDFGILTSFMEFELKSQNWKLPQKVLTEDERREALIHPMYSVPITTDSNLKEMTILAQLEYLSESSCNEILSHPVTRTFLDLKWAKMQMAQAIFSLISAFFFFLYMYTTYRIYVLDFPLHRKGNFTEGVLSRKTSIPTLLIIPILLLGAVLLALTEIGKAEMVRKLSHQIARYPLKYLGLRVWMKLAFLALVATTTLPAFLSVDKLYGFLYPLAVTGVLLASIFILQIIGDSNFHFGLYSIYIHVYVKVIFRFWSVMITFSPLIMAFAISFHIVFDTSHEFSGFWRTVFRLTIMLQGEFDYESKVFENYKEDEVMFWAAQILFALFGCILTLVLVDVFLGYTVSDIQELRTRAEHYRLCNQIKHLFFAEEFLHWIGKSIKSWRLRKTLNPDSINVVKEEKKSLFRNDVVVFLDELTENRKDQFKPILL